MIIKTRPGATRVAGAVNPGNGASCGLINKTDERAKKRVQDYLTKIKDDSDELQYLLFAATDVYCGSSHTNSYWVKCSLVLLDSYISLDDQEKAGMVIETMGENGLLDFSSLTLLLNKFELDNGKRDKDKVDLLKSYFKNERGKLVKKALGEDDNGNSKLMKWANAMEFQTFDGEEYSALDNVCKIICIAGDFISLTEGKWTLSDILLLKTALVNLDVNPKEEINVLELAQILSYNPPLVEKLLGEGTVIEDYDSSFEELNLMILAYIGKKNCLDFGQGYVVDAIQNVMESNGFDTDREEISENLTIRHMASKYGLDFDKNLECFDVLVGLIQESKLYLNDVKD